MTPTEIVCAMMSSAGWTQAQLGRALGHNSRGTISNLLRRGNPTFDTMTEMAEVMGYEIVIRSKEDPATEFVVTPELESGRG